MKALAYTKAHPLSEFSIAEVELPEPKVEPKDLLVSIKAISTNPVDFKIRKSRSAADGVPVVLGWDAAGTVTKVGTDTSGFAVGDEVYYSGELLRAGAYAELQAIDSRLVAKKPKKLFFPEAAALPLTSVTAWEALFEKGITYNEGTSVLVIGGAGGVGSIATQLLRSETKARVIATASRPETIRWCELMGANDVIDHTKDLAGELKRIDCENVDVVFSTTHTDRYLETLSAILRPFGHFVLIDDPKSLDIVSLKRKSISTHWELMFTKSLHRYRMETQGEILQRIATLVDEGHLKTTANLVLQGLTPENIRRAHTLGEEGKAIGKIVIEV